MGDQELKELLHRYKNNTATYEEKAMVESWYLQHREDDVTEYTLQQRLEDADSVWAELQPDKKDWKIKPLLVRIAAAASVLVFLSAGGYFMLHHKQIIQQVTKIQPNDIAPGGNKAILTLVNGNKISITDAKNGVITQQAGTQINKTKNGQLGYRNNNCTDHCLTHSKSASCGK